MAYKGVTDKRNSHAGTGDVIGSHLLIQFQDYSWRKAIGLAETCTAPAGVIFLFQQNKGFIFKLPQGNRGGFFVQKSPAADIFYRKLIGGKEPVDRKDLRDSKKQMFFVKETPSENSFIEWIIVNGQIQNAGEEEFFQACSAFLNEVDRYQWEVSGKFTDQTGQEAGRKKTASAERQMTGFQTAEIIDKAGKGIFNGKDLLYRLDVAFPTFCEGERGGVPVEDGITNLCLDPADIGTEGRLGNVEIFCSF